MLLAPKIEDTLWYCWKRIRGKSKNKNRNVTGVNRPTPNTGDYGPLPALCSWEGTWHL